MVMNSVKIIIVLFLIYRILVILLRYILSVLNVDFSVVVLFWFSGGVIKEVMKFLLIKYCDCKVYKVRMLWIKDMKEFNLMVI